MGDIGGAIGIGTAVASLASSIATTTTNVLAAEDQRAATRKAKRAQKAEAAIIAQRENEARINRQRRARRYGNAPATLFGSLTGAPTSKLGGGT